MTELLTSAKQVDAEIAPAVVNALAVVTESAGKNMGAQVKEGLKELVDDADSTPGKPIDTTEGIELRSDLLILLRARHCRPICNCHPETEASSLRGNEARTTRERIVCRGMI